MKMRCRVCRKPGFLYCGKECRFKHDVKLAKEYVKQLEQVPPVGLGQEYKRGNHGTS